MIPKRWFTYQDLHAQVLDITRQITRDGWKPDYVVGLTRGGLLPAIMLSHWFGVPCETLKVSLRDGGESETNCWMAEDAMGFPRNADDPQAPLAESRKNILIVDDINDSGATMEWIKNDWRSGCLPNDTAWDDAIWHGNVRFAVLVNNLASDARVDYHATEINKSERDVWIVFPWEEWWNQSTAD